MSGHPCRRRKGAVLIEQNTLLNGEAVRCYPPTTMPKALPVSRQAKAEPERIIDRESEEARTLFASPHVSPLTLPVEGSAL